MLSPASQAQAPLGLIDRAGADREARPERLLQDLARKAGLADTPSLVIGPGWMGQAASAVADLNAVIVHPALLNEDDESLRCVLAHELGHLCHGHGRGEVRVAIFILAGIVAAGLATWLGAGDGAAGVAVTAGLMATYHGVALRRQRRYETDWETDPREAEAHAFAERLVGSSYAAFRERF